ncbi:MAG: hypothetical protein LBC61_01820 [Candidatus Peribacteria bacterium]|nr:hypothetical protein [Candidatus Peribacteria bacterium]
MTIPINAYGNIIIKANYTCNSGYYENGTNCNMLSLTTRTFYDCDKNVT